MIISKKMLNFASETEHKTMDKIIEITNNQSRHAEGIYDNHHKESLEVDYSDDDIVILDNMRDIVAAEPMRFMMNGVFVCFNGTIQVDVNGQQHTYHKNQLVMFPPNTTLDNYLFSVDFECKALLMTNHIIQRFMRPYIDVWNHVVYVKKILERQLTDIDILPTLPRSVAKEQGEASPCGRLCQSALCLIKISEPGLQAAFR